LFLDGVVDKKLKLNSTKLSHSLQQLAAGEKIPILKVMQTHYQAKHHWALSFA
jgi:hypothetical protein